MTGILLNEIELLWQFLGMSNSWDNGGNKVVLVTGAAEGLGKATALALASRKVRVGICDINQAGASETALQCSDILKEKVDTINVDLASVNGPEEAVNRVVQNFGYLDGLVNNAGCAAVEPFLSMTPEAWDSTYQINIRAVALLCANAGQAMINRKGGRIVNITSPAARMALPNYAHYAASKAAVDSITRTAAVALAPYGISVNSVAPGMMDTRMQESTEKKMAKVEGRQDLRVYLDERTNRIPAGRRTDPDEMAKLVVWLLLDAPQYVTAERLNGSGGLDRD